MVRRIYSHNGFKHVASGLPAGLVTDGNGGYFSLHPSLSFRGWFRFSRSPWRMQKIIDSIQPLDEGECTSFHHLFYGLKREFSSGARDAFYLYGRSLVYECFDIKGRVKLSLDHREAYEESRLGRHYDVSIDGSTVTITFRQLDGDGNLEYDSHLVIRGVREPEAIGSWRQVSYDSDRERGARSEYWVYDALTFLPSRHVVFSSASTDYEARTVADIAYHHSEEIVSTIHKSVLKRLPETSGLGSRRNQMALLCASHSLHSLNQNVLDGDHDVAKGVLAGLPWFFQVWSRDELISLGGLIALASLRDDDSLWADCISIVDRHMNGLREDGLLANRRPHSDLPSADAIGWLASRTNILVSRLREKQRLFDFCSIDTLIRWHGVLLQALSRIKSNYGGDGEFSLSKGGITACLFRNGRCQTWMDTVVDDRDAGREGFRIEVQALLLSLYDASILLSDLLSSDKKDVLARERKLFLRLVRASFIDNECEGVVLDGRFSDGTPDYSLRPNVFLAYYLASGLFSASTWKKAFSAHSEKLFLSWGGVSTLPRSDSRFQPHYTGIDDRSYHRGDSWYFVNNLTALAMHRLAKRSFSFEVLRIMSASATDILDFGLAGHASEVSSASAAKGEGSLAQAWSAGSFIELVLEYYS